MKPIKFEQANIVFGEGQEQYHPLPAYRHRSPQGEVVTCWQLTPEELERVKETGCIWVSQLTFNQALQPLVLVVDCPLIPAAIPPDASDAVLDEAKSILQQAEASGTAQIKPIDAQHEPEMDFSVWLSHIRIRAHEKIDKWDIEPYKIGHTHDNRLFWMQFYTAGHTPDAAHDIALDLLMPQDDGRVQTSEKHSAFLKWLAIVKSVSYEKYSMYGDPETIDISLKTANDRILWHHLFASGHTPTQALDKKYKGTI
jgi:hypothetical protein